MPGDALVLLLRQVLELVDGTTDLPPDLELDGVASLDRARPGHVAFADTGPPERLLACQASAILVRRDFPPCAAPLVRVDDPRLAFLKVMSLFGPAEALPLGVHPTAVVDEGAELGPDVRIGPFCHVAAGARIGARTRIHAHVTIGPRARVGEDCDLRAGVRVERDCVLGDRVVVFPNAVIGADGFGFAQGETGLEKFPQMGTVRIGSDVEIGANTTIDRATMPEEATIIGEGTKIDNLVQIGHNCVIGRQCVVAAQTGISGSVEVGDGCVFGGQSGIRDHVRVGARVRLGGRAGVIQDVPEGSTMSGYPAQDHRAALRQEATLRHLPVMRQQIRELERRLRELTSRAIGSRPDSEESGREPST